MRVLVTGGAGFIGHHLANELRRQKHYVRPGRSEQR
ncbi:MAG: NAD-dependent epimerase/dehydratase family protein [Caldilineaceae bacterium]